MKTRVQVLSRENVSPALTMLITVFLSTLLMMGGTGGAAASDLQVYGKSNDETLSNDDGGQNTRKQPHQQIKNDILQNLDLESFNVQVMPTTSRDSLPTIMKLYLPTDKPLNTHANMPLRFGRGNIPGDDQIPISTPNIPQRFGRSWKAIHLCAECLGIQIPEQSHRQTVTVRKSQYWRLLRTLVNIQFLNLHWSEDLNYRTSSEVMEMPKKTFNK